LYSSVLQSIVELWYRSKAHSAKVMSFLTAFKWHVNKTEIESSHYAQATTVMQL